MNQRSFALLTLNFLAFVSLGLPDGLLGVAWPSLRATFALPLDALAPLLASFTTGYVVSSFAAGPVLGARALGTRALHEARAERPQAAAKILAYLTSEE